MEIIQGYLGIIEQLSSTKVGFLFKHKVIYFLVILLAFYVLSKLMKFIMNKVIPLFIKKTKTNLDDLIIRRTQKPGSWLILLLGFYIALIPLEIPENINLMINDIILTICVLFFCVICVRVVDTFIDVWGNRWAKKTESSIDDALLPLFHKTSKVLFIIVAFAVILKIWKFNISGLLAGVGIAGMVLGLAFKDSLANIFGGVSIVLDKSLKVGDKVKLSTGELGLIEDIGLRSTKLRTYDNELVTIPNGLLSNTIITNFTMPDIKHREMIKFSVEYGSDVDKVKKVVLKAMQNIPDAIYDPEPFVVFNDMADSGLNFSAFIWSTWDKGINAKLEATKRIYEALNKAKIGIPFPTRTVYMFQRQAKKR